LTSPYNHCRQRLDLASFTDRCDARDLASVAKAIRSHTSAPKKQGSHLSDDEVAELAQAAYAASCYPEEGTYPRFRLLAYPSPGEVDALRTIAVFASPVPVSPNSLRNLARLLPSHEYALRVDSADGRLVLGGIIHISRSAASVPGRPEFWIGGTGGFGGLLLRVDGPGDIRIQEFGVCVTLRAGQIEELVSFSVVPDVHEWLDRAADSLKNRMRVSESESQLELHLLGLVDAVWSHVLANVVSARHGGTLAILPDPLPGNFVHLEYEVESLDLGAAITTFCEASIAGTRQPEIETFGTWLAARDALFATASQVAGLANVDGCVWLSPELSVVGFGGEIRVSRDDLEDSADWVDAVTGEERNEEQIEALGGTRHRSACRLARVWPDALVFVVSQDGELRVFANHQDAKKVHAFEHLSAWAMEEDRA